MVLTMSKTNIDRNLDEALLLLEELNEEEIATLNEEFDPENSTLAASDRKREEERRRMFIKTDMIKKLEKVVHTGIKEIASRSTLDFTKKDYSKKTESNRRSGLTDEEEKLFDGITEEELIEFAALSSMHGMITQAQSTAIASGDPPPKGGILDNKPVRGPRRPHLSLSDEDTDLDVPLLLEYLDKDGEEIFYIRINNIILETYILNAIFNRLKDTRNLKHLSLSNVGLNDEKLLNLIEALKENKSLETLNLECNDISNFSLEPLTDVLLTHSNFRELKMSHQKHGLGSRGEEAMAKLMSDNTNVMKISYPFQVPSSRSLVDRCMIRNQDLQRKKRSNGEDFYNFTEAVKTRDAHPQPWIRNRDPRDQKLKGRIAEQKVKMKSIPNVAKMRAEARIRARENAKPIIDDELATKLRKARVR